MKVFDLTQYTINIDEVRMIFEPVTNPVKEKLKQVKKDSLYLHLAGNESTRTIIELKDGRWVGTAFTLSELYNRVKEL